MTRSLLSIGILLGDNCRPDRVKRCLHSLEPLRRAVPCQVLVGDLGAPAAVRAAAEAAGLLFGLTWTGDLSQARNTLLDRCEGAWFLALSPNEYLDEDITGLVDFLHDGGNADGAYLMGRARKGGGPHRELLRLIRRSTGARFVGALHETVSREACPSRCVRLGTVLHDQGQHDRKGFRDAMRPSDELLALEKEVNRKTAGLAQLDRYMEVCGDVDIRLRVLRSALRGFRWEGLSARDRFCAASLLRHGIRLTDQPVQAEQWLAEGLAHCPDSVLLGMDGHAFLMDLYHRLGSFQGVAEHGARWTEARCRFHAGDYDPAELAVSGLCTSSPEAQAGLLTALGDSLCRLGRWAEADAALLLLTPELLSRLPDGVWTQYAKGLLRRGEPLEHGGALAQRLWESASGQDKRRDWLLGAMDVSLRGGIIRPRLVSMLAALDGAPGASARILLAETAADAAKALSEVDDWGDVLRAAYPHALRLGTALPEGFYRQKAGELADIAAALPRYDPHFPQTAIICGMTLQPETPAQLTWLLDLTAAALRVADVEDTETMEALCRQFQWAAADYLSNIYNPALLNEEDLSALPGLHAFAWCFVQACDANARGDGLEAVRLLRLGLQLTPGMKRAVDFQVRRIQAALDAGASSPALLTVAEQVRDQVTRLRAAGTPGLEALLNAPAYQRFQPLLAQLDKASSAAHKEQ